jgi:uncharacterized membrane-anchored protein
MKRWIPDTWLSALSALSCTGAVIANLKFGQLDHLVWLAVFTTIFLCPALMLLAIWRLWRKEKSIYTFCCLVLSVFGTGIWVYTTYNLLQRVQQGASISQNNNVWFCDRAAHFGFQTSISLAWTASWRKLGAGRSQPTLR